jgi:cytochrome c oxidase cbb3-type subunit 3
MSDKEFDGVRQADNPLPPWWKGIFKWTIPIVIIYAFYFHFFSKWKMADSYTGEVAEHLSKFPEKIPAVAGEGGVNPFRGNAAAIAAGEKTFKTICVLCHGQTGHGELNIGPNLMDAEWLHGDTDAQLYENVMRGIFPPRTKLNRGIMLPQEASLGSDKVYQVLAWLATQNKTIKEKK